MRGWDRVSFVRAFSTGDLAAIEAFLSRPDIRTLVTETEAFVAALSPNELWLPFLNYERFPGGKCPWLYMIRCNGPARGQGFGTPMCTSLLSTAAKQGHNHIIEWFYSPERSATMGATLARALSSLVNFIPAHILRHDRGVHSERNRSRDHAYLLEFLLTSDVFLHVLSAEKQQLILDAVATKSAVPDSVRIAVAHGARVDNDYTVHNIVGNVNDPDVVDALVREGAFVVGADVLSSVYQMSSINAIERLVEHGIDTAVGSGERLAVALKVLWGRGFLNAYVVKGHGDVDAHGADGVTLLMRAAGSGSKSISQYIVEFLVAHGADCRRVDAHGDTAWDHAVRAGDSAVAELLQSADASVQRPVSHGA